MADLFKGILGLLESKQSKPKPKPCHGTDSKYVVVKCNNCKGSGRSRSLDCYRCNGTGLLRKEIPIIKSKK